MVGHPVFRQDAVASKLAMTLSGGIKVSCPVSLVMTTGTLNGDLEWGKA